jgi:hypothetical protein
MRIDVRYRAALSEQPRAAGLEIVPDKNFCGAYDRDPNSPTIARSTQLMQSNPLAAADAAHLFSTSQALSVVIIRGEKLEQRRMAATNRSKVRSIGHTKTLRIGCPMKKEVENSKRWLICSYPR